MAEDISEIGDKPSVEIESLEDRIAAILIDIEQEKTPKRLLECASALQQALILHRQRQRPN